MKEPISEERQAIVKEINAVSRCMCPFTPGAAVEGWTPNFKLGMDGKHREYCPFGIAHKIANPKKIKDLQALDKPQEPGMLRS